VEGFVEQAVVPQCALTAAGGADPVSFANCAQACVKGGAIVRLDGEPRGFYSLVCARGWCWKASVPGVTPPWAPRALCYYCRYPVAEVGPVNSGLHAPSFVFDCIIEQSSDRLILVALVLERDSGYR